MSRLLFLYLFTVLYVVVWSVPCSANLEYFGLTGRLTSCSSYKSVFCGYGSVPTSISSSDSCQSCPFELVWNDYTECLIKSGREVAEGHKIVFYEGANSKLSYSIVQCSGGEWCPGADSSGNGDPFGRACPIGMHAINNNTECVMCPGVLTGNYTIDSICTECPAGYIINYDVDNYYTTGDACVPAPSGYWSNTGWYMAMEPAAGTYTKDSTFFSRTAYCNSQVTSAGQCLEYLSGSNTEVYNPLIHDASSRNIECNGLVFNPYTHECDPAPGGYYIPSYSTPTHSWISLEKVEVANHYSAEGSLDKAVCQDVSLSASAKPSTLSTVAMGGAVCITCSIGEYLDTTTLTCQICLPGHFCDGRFMQRCPPNTYNGTHLTSSSYSACNTCTTGVVSRQRTHCFTPFSSTLCGNNGFFAPQLGDFTEPTTSNDEVLALKFCNSCADDSHDYSGMYCPDNWNIYQCPPDTYLTKISSSKSSCSRRSGVCPIDRGRVSCQKCTKSVSEDDDGKIQWWDFSLAECNNCPPNHYCDDLYVIPCPPNYFSEEGSSICTYCQGVITERGVCKGCTRIIEECPWTSSTCTDCSNSCDDGNYWDNAQGRCIPCEPGFACFESRHIPCPVNLYQGSSSSYYCEVCDGGIPTDTIIVDESVVYYGENIMIGCIDCADRGNYYANMDDLKCDPCLAGNYCVGGNIYECEYGYYQPEAEQSECILCMGTVSADRTECRTCDAGEYYDTDDEQCYLCPLGYYCLEGKMIECEENYYTDDVGLTECIFCAGYVVDERRACLIDNEATQYEYQQSLANNDTKTTNMTWVIILVSSIVIYLFIRRIVRIIAHKHGLRYPIKSNKERQEAIGKATSEIVKLKKDHIEEERKQVQKQAKELEKVAQKHNDQKQKTDPLSKTDEF